jgi:hypothetical protein
MICVDSLTRITAGRAGVRQIGAAIVGMLPWTLVPRLDPSDRREPFFTAESFCPALGEVEIGSTDSVAAGRGFVNELRFGAVGVNVGPAQLSAIGSAPWGRHPSSVVSDVQSGRGWLHNTAMLEEVEKAVIRQPVTLQLKPAYVPGHRAADTLLRRLTTVERGAGWAGLTGVLDAALRG